MKLARIVTGVQAAWGAINQGFTQEGAALQRILDELGSDLQFLAGPLTMGKQEEIHDRFLADFFQEEFEDGKSPVDSSQKRNRVPRKKIRAYNARTFTPEEATDRVVAVQETIDNMYSGFVHGAGPHIMDLYGGTPPHFHVEGMGGTSRQEDAAADFRNYLHRAMMDASVAARALGDEELSVELMHKSDSVGREFGTLPEDD